MKYSVSSYSYMKMIRAGEITPFEVIAKTKELGFDAIEFVDFVDFLPLAKERLLPAPLPLLLCRLGHRFTSLNSSLCERHPGGSPRGVERAAPATPPLPPSGALSPPSFCAILSGISLIISLYYNTSVIFSKSFFARFKKKLS